MKASPIITTFNSGELSPMMAGRVDLKYYQNACKKLLNFIPTVQGPVTKRPGTYFARGVKDSADRTWLRRFVFNQDQSYILEFGDLYIRFYTNSGIIEASPGVPYEIATPFTAASLTRADGTFRLKFHQTGDVLYITSDGQYPVQKLTRLTASTFSIANLETTGGPFLDIDPTNTVTIYSSANTGTVTLTASSSIFTANHVGSLILLEQRKVDDIKQWESGKSVTLDAVRRSDGKNYKALNAATTGSVRPVHAEGSRFDGDAGVQWEFLDAGYGWAEITAYTSGTVVTASVISRIPDGAVGSGQATTRWAFGAFSAVEGWPDNVTLHRERLCFSKGLKVYGSVAADFENFNRRDDSGLITKDMAFIIDITSDEANNIVWMAPSQTALLVGTTGEEGSIDEITQSEAFGPGNIKFNKQSAHGSAYAGAELVGDGVIYVQASKRKIRDMMPAESVDRRWSSADSTVLADHITRYGVVSMAYQQEPDSIVWCACSCGSLIGFTVNREQDVRGWHPHQIGGSLVRAASDGLPNTAAVECVESIPVDGGDQLWMIVKRTINGNTVRYVEFMTQSRRIGDDPEDAVFLDSALTLGNSINATLTPGTGGNVAGATGVTLTAGSSVFVVGDVGRRVHYRYAEFDIAGKKVWKKAVAEITGYTSGTVVTAAIHSPFPDLSVIAANKWRMTVTSISGLDHLEGQTVTVCGDGGSSGEFVVSSGSITLTDGVSKAHVGLPYRSVLIPMPIEAGAADGTSQGKTKRISRCGVRLLDTFGLKVGGSETGQLDDIDFRDAIDDDMDVAPGLFTGDIIVPWPDGYGAAEMVFLHEEPVPCTIVALMPQVTTQDAR